MTFAESIRITVKDSLFIVAAVLGLLLMSSPLVLAVNKKELSHADSEKNSSLNSWHAHSHQENNGVTMVTFNVTVDAVTLEESNFFIKKIFTNYGSDYGMSLKDLENLLHKLGLGKREESAGHVRKERSYEPEHAHSTHSECLTVNEMLDAFHLASHVRLRSEEFSYLCPALIYQLDIDVCTQYHGRSQLENSSLDLRQAGVSDISSKVSVQAFHISQIPPKVWGFSTVAVLVISLVGLLGVAVIPIMQKVFYNHLLQFLVALAVGALAGDALLHLLPHSIMTSPSHKHDVQSSFL